MKEKVFKKRTRNYVYNFFPLSRTVVKFNLFNHAITYTGYGCATLRCVCSNSICKFCPYCII